MCITVEVSLLMHEIVFFTEAFSHSFLFSRVEEMRQTSKINTITCKLNTTLLVAVLEFDSPLYPLQSSTMNTYPTNGDSSAAFRVILDGLIQPADGANL